jgi:ADP-heptose:LPS heptosyltransferase
MASLLHRIILRVLAPRSSPRTRVADVREKIRLVCFTSPGISDFVHTLPLLHALRRHYPKAHMTVACEPCGVALAQACKAVDEVVVLEEAGNFWLTARKNAAKLRHYDWALVAKDGYDPYLATLCRLTNAPIRIGFERNANRPSPHFTDPVELPAKAGDEHQVETLLRLLKPLGLVRPTTHTVDLSLRLPDSAREFVNHAMSDPPFSTCQRPVLICLSGWHPVRFLEEDFIALLTRLLGSTDHVIGLVAAPLDQQKAHEIAVCMGSKRVAAVDIPGSLELAAFLETALCVITPEGDAAHLAAAVGRPTVVLWSDRPFKKWSSRGKRQIFVHREPGEKTIPVERVWKALEPFLTPQKDDFDKKWADLLESPPVSGFDS